MFPVNVYNRLSSSSFSMLICLSRRFDLLRWGLALMLFQTLGEALAMRNPQSLDSGGLRDYIGFLAGKAWFTA